MHAFLVNGHIIIAINMHYITPPTQSGLTSLHCACDEGHTAVVQLLIESQAKLNIKDNVSCIYAS